MGHLLEHSTAPAWDGICLDASEAFRVAAFQERWHLAASGNYVPTASDVGVFHNDQPGQAAVWRVVLAVQEMLESPKTFLLTATATYASMQHMITISLPTC